MDPSVEQVLVASIIPPNFDIDRIDWSNITQKELDCTQLNACKFVMMHISFGHFSWRHMESLNVMMKSKQRRYGKPECDDEKQAEEKLLEECSTTAISIDPQVSLHNEEEGQKDQATVSLQNPLICALWPRRRRRAKKGSQKIEVSSPLVKELELLKSNYASLVSSQSRIEHVFVESCDDHIAQENDELMQEVERIKKDLSKLKSKSQVQPSQDNCEIMVEKIEKGSTVTCSAPQHLKICKSKIQENNKFEHIKCFNCSKMENFASTYPAKLKGEETLSNRQRSLARKRVCYGCKEKGHVIATCPTATSKDGSDLDQSDQFLKSDCPNGNTLKSNLVHCNFSKLRNDKAGICAIRVIASPRTSIRSIQVPKHLVANLYGPNKVWVPKNAC
ncbi:hypothetical protein SETIT_4G094700v2 [Setaria italica]|uniref:CCHC-type domain-containing protein n=1 Tax=Setaria italica TaxID=4555 RepID=K3Y2V0_SETIT|nr:hypothetical protein SETIT_4G094700v2 [Setaria italica]